MSEPVLLRDILPGVMANIRGRIRRRVLEQNGYRCRKCGDEAVIVCYETYDDGDIERAEDLISLCAACHDKHELTESPSESID